MERFPAKALRHRETADYRNFGCNLFMKINTRIVPGRK